MLDTRRSTYAQLQPVPIGAVRLDDAFWAPRLHTMRTVGLPAQYAQHEQTGRIDNFRRAAGLREGPFQGRYYNDSDVYKWLEAASYALASQPDPALDRLLDRLIDDIAAAQQPDGYLNTYFTFERAAERYTDLANKHELYLAGHLIQAAIAHHRATGKAALFRVALRLADHICATFGPDLRPGTDGHAEIELALVELTRETGDARYLRQAEFFLEQRGQSPPVIGGRRYHQDHRPARAQTEAVGHSVRLTYLACGMADVALETGDPGFASAAERLWESAFQRKGYLTGGLGSRHEGEDFGDDYELPNDLAYAETCAAVGGIMWSWRLLARTSDARYADALETALYNGALAGVSLDGRGYFYTNPLADAGAHRRDEWFLCACCPPNIARLLLSLPGYLYSTSGSLPSTTPAAHHATLTPTLSLPGRGSDPHPALWVHLYAQGSVHAALPNGELFALRVETDYPWDGAVRLEVLEAPAGSAALMLRIPTWCAGATLALNGAPLPDRPLPGTYHAVSRTWRAGERVDLTLPMPPRRVVSHPRVLANTGRVALARGPMVYCLEGCDHPGVDLFQVALPAGAPVTAEHRPDLLGGVTVLRAEGVLLDPWPAEAGLYATREALRPSPAPGGSARTASEAQLAAAVPLTAVPYATWANRDPGPMQVWMREASAVDAARDDPR